MAETLTENALIRVGRLGSYNEQIRGVVMKVISDNLIVEIRLGTVESEIVSHILTTTGNLREVASTDGTWAKKKKNFRKFTRTASLQ
jgi:hypothetical protein